MKKIILLVGSLVFTGLGIFYLNGNDLFEMYAAPTILVIGVVGILLGISELLKKQK